MGRFKEKLVEGKEFIITCEFVPGRGAKGASIEAVIEFGKKAVSSNLPIHAISITDNPGGNPAVSPDVLGKELQQIGIEPLIHFSCSHSNRNLIESRAYALARDGLENLLVVTGDHPTSGYMGLAKPVFDLDSVQAIRYLKEMNEGLKTPGRKAGTFDSLPETDFVVGCAVSPFKRIEAELMTQLFKLENKVQAGADFIITQLGYDVRKFAEILKYMKYRGINARTVGNVYVITRPVARLMNRGLIPGCVVTDELLRKIEEEAEAPDKGREARLERAAQFMAIFKGIGYNGVHIGGFGLRFEDFEFIINRAKEIENNWRDYLQNFQYHQRGEFYYFPEDEGLSFSPEKLIPNKLEKPWPSLGFQASRLFHWLVFKEGTPGYRIAKLFYRLLDRSKFATEVFYFLERVIKQLLFDCQECGDCALFDLAYLCPMSKCAKFQRNGPCGGSKDGMCEVHEDKKCFWVMVYERLSSINRLDDIRKEFVPPPDLSLRRTSSWANYFLDRDHASKKKKVETPG